MVDEENNFSSSVFLDGHKKDAIDNLKSWTGHDSWSKKQEECENKRLEGHTLL